MAKLKRLFEPVMIGKMELKNRIVMPAMCTMFGTAFGEVNNRDIDFYVERAKGGVGLIIIENTCVEWPRGKAGASPIRIDDFKFISGLHDLAEAVHPYGTKIATQLHHTGRQNSVMFCTEGVELVAPSAIPCMPIGGDMPKALTVDEIKDLVNRFVLGAARTQMAGFDAVEIHGAHGYLITQFMSPYTNKRTDEYGGDFDRRMRFALEIVKGIRAAVGPDFPIIFRMSADECVEGGLTLKDSKMIAKKLEDAGVDAISVSAGIYESKPWHARIFPPSGMPMGCNLDLAQGIKEVVAVPVIVAGRLSPLLGEKALEDGKADLIAIGRPLLADPNLPRKAQEGRLDDIRPCLYCNEKCIGNLHKLLSVSCQVNASVGREREYEIRLAQKAKRVLIVGGGPGGMEAARVAALRGHKVSLYEKDEELGGQLVPASVPSFKDPIKDLIKYFKLQLEKLAVRVETGRQVNLGLIKELKPDVVVLATGATPIIPEIPGASNERVVTAVDVLLGKKKVGREAIIVGGGEVGSELAWHLAGNGKKVTLIEMTFAVARDMCAVSRGFLLDKLDELGVNIMLNTTVKKITDEGVIVSNAGGEKQVIKGDTVVLCVGFKANKGLQSEVEDIVPEVYTIGDCVKPGKIFDAIHGGAFIGRQI